MITKEKSSKVKVLNKDTGEIREVESYKVWTICNKNNEQFYQQYANGVLAVVGLKPDYVAKVYMYLMMESNNNELVIDKIVRERMMNDCQLSRASITKALDSLYQNGLLDRLTRGRYSLNPAYGWTGKASDRAKLLKDCVVKIRVDILPNEEVFEIINE